VTNSYNLHVTPRLTQMHHPDRGGSHEAQVTLNEERDVLLALLGEK